jgi:DNA-binding CsgD family transcriptional regulator
MSFSTGYLTTREIKIWDLRRQGHTQAGIGKMLKITRQAAYKALGTIDNKVEQAFAEAAKTNGLEVKKIHTQEGIMMAYSPAHKIPVIVSLSKINGLRIWYMHEGDCGNCIHENNCKEFLVGEAKERGLELTKDDLELPSSLLALRVFDNYLGGES